MTCSVYQYFDASGRLLYVGITNRGVRRSHEHARSKDWWPQTTGCAIEHYESRSEALSRESYLIAAYKPPFNIQGKAKDVAAPVYVPEADVIGQSDKIKASRIFDAIAEHKSRGEMAKAISQWMTLDKRFKKVHGCVACRQRPGASGGAMCHPCWDAYRAGETRSRRRERAAQR